MSRNHSTATSSPPRPSLDTDIGVRNVVLATRLERLSLEAGITPSVLRRILGNEIDRRRVRRLSPHDSRVNDLRLAA